MIGRQTININKSRELEELYQIMEKKWDKEKYNTFFLGKPNPLSIEKYICLPATQRYMIIAYPRKGGKFFSRNDKVVLTICDTPDSMKNQIVTSLARDNIFKLTYQISESKSRNEERKGPTEETLQGYTAYMKQILEEEDLL
ncbi:MULTISPECIES: hypothetical protein [Methanobrevibacter]|uniref:Uncharacterized protein n=1 Tax=Methanobrevibacter gottschalkii DSM 11977 TaxID=1122229 RepID=A0A3N5C8J2_9EURY|nr:MULTISPECIES: hypothetical protein [Methanobrevibacter]OEC99911.1 hypothetical protein A9505_03410 [Methanobrevibacter sp. A27]RPF52871.1 hypothetical protein EDC42_0430 [Methanobrevibacter gottschalkii DSM 11977]